MKMSVLQYVFLFIAPWVSAIYAQESSSSSIQEASTTIEQKDPVQDLLAVCSSCHGQDGAAKDIPSIPVLAAQYPDYLKTQLENFSQGDHGPRPSALMESIAQALSPEEIKIVSQHYGSLVKQWMETPQRNDLKEGRRIYLGGVFNKKIAACSSCHSPTGFGNEPAGYPQLAGQHAEYIIAQLQRYRAKERTHPMMNSISENLSDHEIEAVAFYLQGLRSIK